MKKLTWNRIKEDFNFNRISEVYFYKSEWETFDPHDHDCRVSPFYFTYRFLYMGFFLGSTISTFICEKREDPGLYLIFLTNQTFLVQLIYSTLYFLYLLWVVWRKSTEQSDEPISPFITTAVSNNNKTFHDDKYCLPILCKIIWALLSVLQVVPYVVTVIYWLLLFGSSSHETTCSIVNNVLVHGANSPMALLDFFIIAIPMRRSHLIFPFLAALWYSLFSGLYDLFGGVYSGDNEYIYPMLNWKSNPGLAVGTCIAALFGSGIIHFGMWNVYRLRIYIKSKYAIDSK